MNKGKDTHTLTCRIESIFILLCILMLLTGAYAGTRYLSTISNKNIDTILGEPFRFFDAHKPQPTLPPIGVMLENELAARSWQRGLSSASIVYEAPTEANITRFLALFFQTDEFPKIGPIRSARPYYADWIAEYSGSLAHVGGSSEALAKLARLDRAGILMNIDEFAFHNVFKRENVGKTSLEHTMFSTGEKLRKLVEESKREIKIPAGSTDQISLDEIVPEPVNSIKINFGTKTYTISYRYDSSSDSYLRYQAGQAHIDHNNNQQIAPRTIIVQRVNARNLNDDKFRIEIKTVGQGDAMIAQGGKIFKVRWAKTSTESKTRFFDTQGREINIDKRPVWIEIVPEYDTVEYSH